MIRHIRDGEIHADETVVFLHTGGMPALFTEDFVKAMGPGIP
jgi:1-aminocyclopropane-1-carboxylate deaminase/D-cysteine desulfhydrase-like pyridoxal-dependent ACC family enzyme